MEKRVTVALGISLAIFIMEIVGGVVSGSLALISDAGHVLADAIALALSLYSIKLARRSSNDVATFGYHRVGVLVALVNGTMLVVMAALIFREAYERFISPPSIKTTELLIIAAVGLVANLVMVWLLHRDHQHSLSVKSAWLHVMGDALASLGVIISGLVIYFTGWTYADSIASIFIGIIIFIGGCRVIREAGFVLLELAPRHLNSQEIIGQMKKVPGVLDVHDFHLWMITPQLVALSAHVVVEDQAVSDTEEIFNGLQGKLKEMGIEHTTLQMECRDCGDDMPFCRRLQAPDSHAH